MRNPYKSKRTRKGGSSSKYRGVSRDKYHKCWRASIKMNGKVKNLGMVASETMAALRYDTAARSLGYPECVLNFPIVEAV